MRSCLRPSRLPRAPTTATARPRHVVVAAAATRSTRSSTAPPAPSAAVLSTAASLVTAPLLTAAAAVEADEPAAAAGGGGVSVLEIGLALSPAIFYLILTAARQVNPKLKISDLLFVLVGLVIVANIVSILFFKTRIY